MKDMKDLQKAVIEKEADNRPQEISEVDVEAMTGDALKGNELVDVLALANLDVEELLKDNESFANFISAEIEKAEVLIKIKKNIPQYEALLRKMIEANCSKGVFADTQPIKDLKAQIDAAKEFRVGEEVDEAALEVVNFRNFYTEVQDSADKVRSLLKSTKEEADAEVDGLVDKYRGFFEKLWKNRHIQEVPDEIVDEWKRKHVSFSDYAFSAKNPKGKKIWCWGIKGNIESMAVAKAMRRFYADLDTLLFRLKKANQPDTPSEAPADAPAPQQE
ncbi:hypothetical protein A2662_02835 [Candidatus Giovannonibacteria bacterium RIFCSPHIGHO2_01_FULL_45_33]|uniref:Uncharacterized protein n=1 Tax=Candidatus Giovannonibacteria bacterium RIFCSPLOWO2_01_FULL_45_34 TaxID=1798351 RepID=A0A1F5X1E8_9BACT|nr:MAG: hypothetical protein A2662_02835 [Candidatus Giovannonibacteria bacterium RIFCSPHIGHO2_01_FULL_45_33]OGF70919.1 MAG: hypothetical protein A3C73_00900 [Candidatus Giovannonibacteria bacterium RIFCSPHIGHO2_02_FULL_44_11]OGF81719.1 MAG: hypothetical protein A2930_03910 [Candidatus Giovannonibacteria bacterium RIFCSPLOWO2_01_FULL_45_34]